MEYKVGMKLRCKVNLNHLQGKHRTFTKGKVYEIIATEGDSIRFSIVFIDDHKEEHHISGKWLKHFEIYRKEPTTKQYQPQLTKAGFIKTLKKAFPETHKEILKNFVISMNAKREENITITQLLRDRSLAQCDPSFALSYFQNYTDVIWLTFNWENTEQGCEYWDNILHKLYHWSDL